MARTRRKIKDGRKVLAVVGSVSIDMFRHEDDGVATSPSKHQRRQLRMRSGPGASWLLADLIQQQYNSAGRNETVVYAPAWSHFTNDKILAADVKPVRWPSSLELGTCQVSYIEVDQYADRHDPQTTVYRCSDISGIGEHGRDGEEKQSTTLQSALADADDALLVVNHAGGQFAASDLLNLLKTGDDSTNVLLKARWPHLVNPDSVDVRAPDAAELRELYYSLVALNERLVVVLNADDIRAAGISISKGISWDKTAADVVLALHHSNLRHLLPFDNVIIRFGIDGALQLARNKSGESHSVFLYYDPTRAEGDFATEFKGNMSGFGTVFCASLALDSKLLFDRGDKDDKSEDKDGGKVGIAIRQAIVASRRLLECGYRVGRGRTKEERSVSVNHHEVFDRKDQLNRRIARSVVPTDPYRHNSQQWSFLSEIADDHLISLATGIVRDGEIPTLAFGLPKATFGALETLDRVETEGYRSVRNLLKDYLGGRSSRPLSIAVFGQPGSGKSFGVKEIAESLQVQPGSKDWVHEFNVAQLSSPKDIPAVLHIVRNDAVGGKVPLVFFDEFDASLDGQPLGWLKYFLAPMQDGAFIDNHMRYPIGRAIFVFAGGTASTFQGFRDQLEHNQQLARDRKLPDFISRLRGYVDVAGPNRRNPADTHFIVRRAVLLRSLISRNRPLLLGGRKIDIDAGVLRAFLEVDQFFHGARSIEAIIEMSALVERKRFDRSALPSASQLSLHVDETKFMAIVNSWPG